MGEAPDRPRVEIDIRRRLSCAGPGKALEVLLERPKMLLKVWVVKEPRRGRAEESEGMLLSLLLVMVGWLVGMIDFRVMVWCCK